MVSVVKLYSRQHQSTHYLVVVHSSDVQVFSCLVLSTSASRNMKSCWGNNTQYPGDVALLVMDHLKASICILTFTLGGPDRKPHYPPLHAVRETVNHLAVTLADSREEEPAVVADVDSLTAASADVLSCVRTES